MGAGIGSKVDPDLIGVLISKKEGTGLDICGQSGLSCGPPELSSRRVGLNYGPFGPYSGKPEMVVGSAKCEGTNPRIKRVIF